MIIDFLSLDVNGYELNVLRGMEKSIKNIKCIRFSMNSFQIHTENHFKDYYQFLRNNNFELFGNLRDVQLSVNKYSCAVVGFDIEN